MIFNYKALENNGKETTGTIEAVSMDVAIGSLQKRGLILVEIEPESKERWWQNIHLGKAVPNKDVVILSKQMATLFEAQVSPLKIFTLLAAESGNPTLRRSLE